MNEALSILERHGAIVRDGHFVYTSGRHGSVYVNKDAIYPHTEAVCRLCHDIAMAGRQVRYPGIEAVVGPAMGGAILSQWVSRHLGIKAGKDVLALYAERSEGGGFELRRGYDRLVTGKRALVVEDVITTGGSVKGVIEATQAAGGIVAGVACLVNRGGVTAEQIGSPAEIVSLVDLPLESWEPGDCPLCAAGMPVDEEVGKGREFVAAQVR
jgi:orotate phosphoribosyltransferase